MEFTEKRLVNQYWIESDYEKTGWYSHDWHFITGGGYIDHDYWKVVEILKYDKFGNPTLGIAERIINTDSL